ncbi:MAG: amino acid permease [Clostridia bacterium]|nr:amino acid permease [Clostridia bacterium]
MLREFLFTICKKYVIINKSIAKNFFTEEKPLENNQLEKRYGLFTAICMVVGIVIGSGVFFKAQDILNYTGGNMLLGILAWVIGGVVMVICALNFANLATKYSKVNGIVDYSEAIVGEKYAYITGWFISTIYFPAMTSVLAWVSARYTLVLFDAGADVTSGLCMSLGAFYLCLAYAVNILAPRLAGKLEVGATIIKLIPLAIMVIVGTIVGLVNGNTIDALVQSTHSDGGNFSSVFAGIAAAAFAYEGWIIATSINAELKNPKRNLPIALVAGTLLIMVIYITYFIGLTGGASVEVLQSQGATTAFKNLFGNIGGTVLNVFIVVSCLGTLNGLMLASTRTLYSVAVRGHGPSPKTFSQVDPNTNMPTNSGVLALICCAAWYFYFYASNLTTPIFGIFSFDSSELPIITTYAIYIPIFVMFIVKEGKKNILKNTVMPILGIIASLFMIFVAVYAHGIKPFQEAAAKGEFAFPVLFYLIVFAVIMGIGLAFYKKKEK